MAIPAMISEFSQQQVNYGAAVGQSLIALGQQVGQQLATREYQRQAQAALPALQQTYSSALDKIEAGNVTEGYRDMMNARFQFGATQNPFLERIVGDAEKTALAASEAYMKQYQAQMQYGGRGGGGGGTTTTAIPGVNASRYGFKQPVATQSNQQNPPPPGTIVEPEEGLPKTADYLDAGGDAQAVLSGNVQPQDGTPQQNEAARNVQSLFSLPPDQQAGALATFGTTQFDPNQFDVEKIVGLNKYLPGFEAFLVPKKEWIENKARLGPGGLTSESALIDGQNRENFYKQDGTKANLDKAIGVMRDKKMSDLFKSFNNDIFAMRGAATQDVEDGQTIYTIVSPGAAQDEEPTKITLPQYEAISTIAGIAASTAQNAGGTPALFKEQPAPTQPATAGGSVAERVRAQYGAKETGAAQPTAQPTAPVQFSKENPFAKQAEQEMQTKEIGGRKTELETAKKQLADVEREIQLLSKPKESLVSQRLGLPNMPMSNIDKATRFEQLNAEKKRLEKIIGTKRGFRRG